MCLLLELEGPTAWNAAKYNHKWVDSRQRNVVELEGPAACNAAKYNHKWVNSRQRNVVELEGPAACNAAKYNHKWVNSRQRNVVELEGIEPSSKQGRPTLSTRLFQTEFSNTGKTWTTNLCLIL